MFIIKYNLIILVILVVVKIKLPSSLIILMTKCLYFSPMDSATRVTIISTDCSLRKELESAEFCWWLINIHSAILFLVKLDGRFEFDPSYK